MKGVSELPNVMVSWTSPRTSTTSPDVRFGDCRAAPIEVKSQTDSSWHTVSEEGDK